MADKQYDIWNDDDGETEAKKSRGSRRILFFGLVLALVLAVVLVAAYRDGTGLTLCAAISAIAIRRTGSRWYTPTRRPLRITSRHWESTWWCCLTRISAFWAHWGQRCGARR